MIGIARCWARLRNWIHADASEIIVTPSDYSIRRINMTCNGVTFSIDIYDLLNVLRDMQAIRTQDALRPGQTADLTPSQLRIG